MQSLQHTPKYDMFPREKIGLMSVETSIPLGSLLYLLWGIPFRGLSTFDASVLAASKRWVSLGSVSVCSASREFNPRFDENSWELILYFGATIKKFSRKFHGIFLAFLFTFFWYFGAAPNWSTTKKKRGWHYGCFQNSKWLHNMAVPSSWSSSWGCHPFHLKKMRLYIMINGLIND